MWTIRYNAKCCMHFRGIPSSIYLLIFPQILLAHIDIETWWYAYIGWVEPKEHLNCD